MRCTRSSGSGIETSALSSAPRVACRRSEGLTRPPSLGSPRRGPTKGVCHRCIVDEMEEMLVEENPGLASGDAVELVAEWLRTVDEPTH